MDLLLFGSVLIKLPDHPLPGVWRNEVTNCLKMYSVISMEILRVRKLTKKCKRRGLSLFENKLKLKT